MDQQLHLQVEQRPRVGQRVGTVLTEQLQTDGADHSRPQHKARAHRSVAAGELELLEVSDDAKPALLKRYLDRWYWEVKGHFAGLTPQSTAQDLRAAAPSIPVFALG